jgi:hypothetical protein
MKKFHVVKGKRLCIVPEHATKEDLNTLRVFITPVNSIDEVVTDVDIDGRII